MAETSADNSAFISYRRAPGFTWARLIWEGLADRGIDAFLDLESNRAAGRFDERLLDEIERRPYFIVVLTDGTLERFVSPDDGMRREVEHAIETSRIIVPCFIAPFEPARFPAGLPQHIADALQQSQGATIYSQYLSEAIEKLATEMLVPVDIASVVRTREAGGILAQAKRELRAASSPSARAAPARHGPNDELGSGTDAPSSFAFVSYSKHDAGYVDRLVDHLEAHGVRCWLDRDDIGYGTEWQREIEKQLEAAAAVIVVMSPASAASDWVAIEVQQAKDLGKRLFPLLLDGRRFMSLNTLQYDDVTGGRLPADRWLDGLRGVLARPGRHD